MPATKPPRRTVARKTIKIGPRRPNDPVHIKLRRLINAMDEPPTDAEIAIDAGMDPRAFSRLMLGHVPDPRLSTLRRILTAINATLADFEQA